MGKRKQPMIWKRTNGDMHVKFDFNSESFGKIAVPFRNMKVEEKYEFEEISVSVVEVTRNNNSDSIKFQLTDHSECVGQVHVHIYHRTQSIMIQGGSGVVVGRKPFIAFSDFYLEPLFNTLINDKDNNGDVKKSDDEMSPLVKKKIKLLTNDNVEDKIINNVTTSNNSNDAFKISSESKFNEGIVQHSIVTEDAEKHTQLLIYITELEQSLREERESKGDLERRLRNLEELLKEERELKYGLERKLEQSRREERESKDYLKRQLTLERESKEGLERQLEVERESKDDLKRQLMGVMDEKSNDTPVKKQFEMPPPPVTNNDSIKSNEMSSKTRAQVDKFHNQHVLGEHWSGKARNTVCEELPGTKVTKLRISGSTSACVGRDEGEYLYATVNPLHYKGTGYRDMGEEGEKLLGFVGHQVDRKKVAPVHLKGTATLLQDGHVEMDDDIYSLIPYSQSQRIDTD